MLTFRSPLNFACTKISAEYEACIAGLQAALELSVKCLEVYGDSLLIICQTQGKWKIKEEKKIPYHHAHNEGLKKKFEKRKNTHL
jgi:ribonuclease HI